VCGLDPEVKYIFGWSLIFLVGVLIAANLLLVLFDFVGYVNLLITRRVMRCLAKDPEDDDVEIVIINPMRIQLSQTDSVYRKRSPRIDLRKTGGLLPIHEVDSELEWGTDDSNRDKVPNLKRADKKPKRGVERSKKDLELEKERLERAFKNKMRAKILEEIELKPSRFKEMQEQFR